MTPERLAPVLQLDAQRAKHLGEAWVRKRTVAEHMGVSTRTVERWKAAGMPCKPVGKRLVLYRIVDVEGWLGR